VDTGLLNDYVRLGVAELVNRAADRAEKRVEAEPQQQASEGSTANDDTPRTAPTPKTGAAIAAALSLALCTINRFMVASHAGVSALANTSSLFQRQDDDGILALTGGESDPSSSSAAPRASPAALSPRALVLQASPDRTADYNALMNCAFAALKADVVVDGCFVPTGMKQDEKSSPFLQQLVDQTRGVYLSVPSGAAQVGGALSEVLLSVFLPPPSLRGQMNLPRLHDVDFRARCFETGESVDVAQVCNQCLSIFKERAKEACPTCGAQVRRKKKQKAGSGGARKTKLN